MDWRGRERVFSDSSLGFLDEEDKAGIPQPFPLYLTPSLASLIDASGLYKRDADPCHCLLSYCVPDLGRYKPTDQTGQFATQCNQKIQQDRAVLCRLALSTFKLEGIPLEIDPCFYDR